MSARHRYTRECLARTAAESVSLVDMLRRLDQPLGREPLRYLRARLAHYGIDGSHFIDEPLPASPRQRYTRERLEEAAVHCASVSDMVAYLGIAPYSSASRYLTLRLRHFGIDTSHFEKQPGGYSRTIPEDALRTAVADSRSTAEVIRKLGLAVNGANRARVARALDDLRISTRHFLGQGHNRGRSSPYRKSADEILRRRPAGASRSSRKLLHRALQEKGVPYVCAECGTGEVWRGKHLVLEIDHVNGDRLDDRLENLRYLCPSCHSQTLTFALAHPRRRTGASRHHDAE